MFVILYIQVSPHETCLRAPPTFTHRRGNPVTFYLNSVLQGDALHVLQTLPDSVVDLVVTSPPYADQRAATYGGVKPDDYADWFLPISDQLLRVLKPEGSLVLNIKERVVNGERHTYVLELIIAMRRQGWLWTEEYVWHKRNCYPGKWPNRFRDAWERCLHFTKGDWKNTRLANLSETDQKRDNSRVLSGFGKNISNWVGREMAFPTNVVHLATECGNRSHSAAFPVELPTWFIKLFTQPGDLVLDPFLGSGTTAVAAQSLDRQYVGIELNPEYVALAQERLTVRDTANLFTAREKAKRSCK